VASHKSCCQAVSIDSAQDSSLLTRKVEVELRTDDVGTN
jgi:hypothetical protein